MTSSELFVHPVWSRLAAMHWHFLWQGLLIAFLYWSVLKIFAIQSARVRYVLGLTGLMSMAVSTVATFFIVDVAEPAAIPSSEMSARTLPPEETEHSFAFRSDEIFHDENSGVLVAESGEKFAHEVSGDEKTTEEDPAASSGLASSLTPLFLAGWVLGVLILGIRLLAGVGTVAFYRWSNQPVHDSRTMQTLRSLCRRLGWSRAPQLSQSKRAGDAFSFGLFKPVIVLPAAWICQLSPATMESILAHELAHIRRWDVWASLFQRVLESWLFYHPALWWLSKQVDVEREKCCDLFAVSLTGDRLQYVKTLASVAEIQHATLPARISGPILATGMGGRRMQLLERVRHILGETPRNGAASRLLAGALVLAIPAALWVGTAMTSADDGELLAQADDDKPKERERDRPRGEREREGDRPRADREREGDRPRGDREREGDRPRGERERDGDRPRADREREGDRPIRRDGDRREGDRPVRPDGPPREGDRRPPGFPPRLRDGERPRGPFPPGVRGFRRDGEGEPARPGGLGRDLGPNAEMMRLIRELRQEVEQLRREVRELREARGEGGERRERRVIERREVREGDRPDVRDRENPFRREAFPRRESVRERERDADRDENRRPERETDREERGEERERDRDREERSEERERDREEPRREREREEGESREESSE